MGSIPGLGRSPAGGHGNALQYSCLENPMERRAWKTTLHKVAKSQTRLKLLSTVSMHRQLQILLCFPHRQMNFLQTWIVCLFYSNSNFFLCFFFSSFWLNALALAGRDDSRQFQVLEINGKTAVQLLSTMLVQESMRKLISDSDHYTKQFQSHTDNRALNQIKGQFIRNWFSRMLESWRQRICSGTPRRWLYFFS